MAEVKLEHIYKVYPNGTKAVSDFTMDIKDQEFIVFVGPSGCGKSTTLRMIAGLEEISAGELYIDKKLVNDVEPKDRDIAMVFQNYALYPHMTVYENMAFGLELRHMPAEEIHERVLWAANILGLTDYLDRKPRAMSGGQRQRVALGRAILRNPKVMLLDEPLSNLDAKLRAQMRSEIAKLHQQLKTTFIYVTHDQVEAMTLGTRVVVMKLGRVQQIDTPKNLYDYPGNKFVAGFIGTPQMNFFEGVLKDLGDEIEIAFKYSDAKINVPRKNLVKINHEYLDGEHEVYIGIRCENIKEATKESNSKYTIECKISHFEELGNETLIYGDINMQGDGFAETSTRVIFKGSPSDTIKIGNVVKIELDINKLHFFDKNTEENISPRIPKTNIINATIENRSLSLGKKSIKLPEAIKIDNEKCNGRVLIPLDAIKLNEGNEKAKVLNNELINDTYLVHLSFGDNLLFAIGDASIKIGSEININIDLTKIDFISNGEYLIKHLETFDKLYGNFVNYKTYFYHTKDEETAKEIENQVSEISKKYDEKLLKINENFESKKKLLLEKDNSTLINENEREYKDLLFKSKEEINRLKTEFKEKNTSLKKTHKDKIKNIKAQISSQYSKMLKDEKETFSNIKVNNKDKDSIKRARSEYLERKENLPKEKENELNNAINSETLNYETEINALKSSFKREKLAITKKLKEFRIKIAKDKNPLKFLEKEHQKEIKDINKEKEEEISKAKIKFYFEICNSYFEVDDVISNKIVQALGTKVFTKRYLFEFPHDAYRISDKGFEITIIDNLNYGDVMFTVGQFKRADGKDDKLIVKVNSPLEIGSKVFVDFDFRRSHISETGLDIRLY